MNCLAAIAGTWVCGTRDCGRGCQSRSGAFLPVLSAALPRNETLKRGIYSLDVPDRLQRYQQILSLLPDREMDSLFRGRRPQGVLIRRTPFVLARSG